MRNPLPLFLLAAFAATFINPAEAFATLDHPGHDPAARCSWQADVLPAFPPGEKAVNATGRTQTQTLLGAVAAVAAWSVQVLPGYHTGFVYAMDQASPGSSLVTKSYARHSIYGVYRATDCCWPARRAAVKMTCGFSVGALVPNPPGSASAQGVTNIVAANTQVALAVAAAVTTDSSDGGANVALELPGPKGAKVKVNFTIDFDSESGSTDQTSKTAIGPSKPAPDEEYYITTDLDLVAQADGYPFNTGESNAYLREHRVTLDTKVTCGHCSASVSDYVLINGSSYGVTE